MKSVSSLILSSSGCFCPNSCLKEFFASSILLSIQEKSIVSLSLKIWRIASGLTDPCRQVSYSYCRTYCTNYCKKRDLHGSRIHTMFFLYLGTKIADLVRSLSDLRRVVFRKQVFYIASPFLVICVFFCIYTYMQNNISPHKKDPAFLAESFLLFTDPGHRRRRSVLYPYCVPRRLKSGRLPAVPPDAG